MAKGFGAMLADMDMARRAANAVAKPACPLCGIPMEYNGAVWYCASRALHDRELRSRQAAAFEQFEAGQLVFYPDMGYPQDQWLWEPSLQGAILALGVIAGQQVALFMATRGSMGATSFVAYIDEGVDVIAIQWVLADWW